MFYNPTNLSYVEGEEAFFNTTEYVVDIKHSFFGYAKELNDSDRAGFNIFFLDSGWIPETTDEANTGNDSGSLGYYKVYNFLAQGTYSKILNDDLRIGIAFKYFREDIDNMYMQGMGFDLGCHYDIGLGIKLGLSLNNIGPEVRFEGDGLQQYVDESVSPSTVLSATTNSFPLPMVARLGIESQLMGSERTAFIRNKLLGLTLAMDIVKPLDYNVYASIGTEFVFRDMLFVRAGSHLNHDTAGLSAGLGLRFKGFEIDYAISQYGDLGMTGQFGVGLKF